MRDVGHKAHIIEFRQVAVLLQIRALVGRHAGEEVFDEVVRDEGVPEVEFGDVGLCSRQRNVVVAEVDGGKSNGKEEVMGQKEGGGYTFPSATSLKLWNTCSAVF